MRRQDAQVDDAAVGPVLVDDVVDEHGPNGRVVDLRILPSHITRGSKTWQIFAHKLQLDTAQVVIDKFFVMNREQELLLDGIASRSREDSVTLRLRNFDLAPFTQVIERMGYVFEGRTNGSATMKSALHAGEITADILLDSLQAVSYTQLKIEYFIWKFNI